MSLTTRFQGSLGRIGRHFHGSGTFILRPGTEGVSNTSAIPCTAPSGSRADITPENGEQGDLRIAVSAAEPNLTSVPEVGHRAQLDSVWYRIVGTSTLTGDDGVIHYELELAVVG